MNIFQTLCHFFTVLLMGLSLTLTGTDVSANYSYFIDSESLVDELNETFPSVIPDYMQEQYGGLVPESSSLSYPESTVVITGLAVASVVGAGVFAGSVGVASASGVIAVGAGVASGNAVNAVMHTVVAGLTVFRTVAASNADYAVIGATLATIFAGLSTQIIANTYSVGNSLYNFYYNRIAYEFTLKDKENQMTPGSCLIYFGHVSEDGLEYERDACYIKGIPSPEQIYAGQEESIIVKIPQTEDGRVRVGGWTHLDDWVQGQTKVVDTGFIPRW